MYCFKMHRQCQAVGKALGLGQETMCEAQGLHLLTRCTTWGKFPSLSHLSAFILNTIA